MMGDSTLAAPLAAQDERAVLGSRNIPQMRLSTASNPLTSALPPMETTFSSDRVVKRFGVEGKVVLTGGAGTLALASARALFEHGAAAICLLDLPQTLRSSRDAIDSLKADFGDRHLFTLSLDVTSTESVDAAFSSAWKRLGSIDILCCFAGIVGCVPSIDASASQFAKVIDVNLNGSFLCAQAAAKYMIDSGLGGSILFTASISAHSTNFPQPQVAYNVSKAGVSHMTKNLAAEWAVHGIRVNCIAPGYMDTVLNAGDNLKAVRDVWASRCPMGRMGDVEEITGPVVMLCSKRAGRYMTGSEIVVDGGALCF
jgi:sorbose reductase